MKGVIYLKCIEILVEEHDNIRIIIKVIREICFGLTKDMKVPYKDFEKIIEFIRNYADIYHHGKEEDMLFVDMNNELYELIGEGPIQGMLIEHNLGRGYVMDLEIALRKHRDGDEQSIIDIIGNAMGYANLLTKHTNKEDNMIYKYAVDNLKQETLERLNKEFEEFEGCQENIETREKYSRLAKELQEKYI